jgi:formate dehydrogenase major subunit
VWEVEYEWMLSRFASKTFMETRRVTSTHWFDAALLPRD